MIQRYNDFIEIKPMTQYQTPISETLSINLVERTFSSVHVRDPRSDNNKKILDSLKRMYGAPPPCMVIEIITAPSNRSNSMKTTTHEVIYFNLSDLNSDYEKIKNHIYNGVPF